MAIAISLQLYLHRIRSRECPICLESLGAMLAINFDRYRFRGCHANGSSKQHFRRLHAPPRPPASHSREHPFPAD